MVFGRGREEGYAEFRRVKERATELFFSFEVATMLSD